MDKNNPLLETVVSMVNNLKRHDKTFVQLGEEINGLEKDKVTLTDNINMLGGEIQNLNKQIHELNEKRATIVDLINQAELHRETVNRNYSALLSSIKQGREKLFE